MTFAQAALLGAVEGFTEFLPISSTGHLILVSAWLGLSGEAVKTFEIVIQAGALGAVLGLYRGRVASLWRGLFGQDAGGRRLLINLLISTAPALVAGALLHRAIKRQLFTVWPVVFALAAGGVIMLAADRWLRRRPKMAERPIGQLAIRHALLIGVLQCLALWPGTSRAMMTILGGLAVGLSPVAAAEYSFLLALPTLGAATIFDMARGGAALLQEIGAAALLGGFISAAAVAALAVRGLVRYLTRHGLAVFGWYRLALAAVIWGWALRHP